MFQVSIENERCSLLVLRLSLRRERRRWHRKTSWFSLLDLPILKLLVEHVLGVLFREFREYFTIVSKVIDESFESNTIAIKEDLAVDLLELVHF